MYRKLTKFLQNVLDIGFKIQKPIATLVISNPLTCSRIGLLIYTIVPGYLTWLSSVRSAYSMEVNQRVYLLFSQFKELTGHDEKLIHTRAVCLIYLFDFCSSAFCFHNISQIMEVILHLFIDGLIQGHTSRIRYKWS